MSNSSGPQPFWHVKPGSWKTVFAWIQGRGWGDGLWKGCSLPACLLRPSVVSTVYDLADGSPQGSSVHGILQARTAEGVAISSSKGIFPNLPGIEPTSPVSPALAGGFFPAESLRKVVRCTSITSSSSIRALDLEGWGPRSKRMEV